MKPQPAPRPFEVDEHLIWFSYYQEIEVIFRGKVDYWTSVIYDPKSGWQGTVNNTQLKRKEMK